MRSKLLLVFLFCLPFFVKSQDYYKQGSFVIKGNVRNFSEPVFDFGMTTYFNSIVNSVVVKADGSFEQRFPVQYRQDFFLNLNDEIVIITVQNNDTIFLNWDHNDFRNSFSISGTNLTRTKELEFQQKLSYEFVDDFYKLSQIARDLSPQEKFAIINNTYNRNVKAVLDSTATEFRNRLVMSLYFQYTNVLLMHRLIPQFKLSLINDSAKTYSYPDMPNMRVEYGQLNEYWFWNVCEYRDFIFNYIRSQKPFYSYVSDRNSSGKSKPFNPVYDEYHLALANINLISIQEWFITRSIMFGFGRYSFDDTQKIYNEVISTITSSFLKDTLQKYYIAASRLRPGNPAPSFALRNEKAQTVSLNDFKGKVVYIDFWGVGCGPCIYTIKTHVPKLHDQYKNKDVVFINICVDANEKQWKDALKKYDLGGINLIAEGWASHPVCQAYNISVIPHYVLIDKNGKIAKINARDPGSYDPKYGNNEIDALLK